MKIIKGATYEQIASYDLLTKACVGAVTGLKNCAVSLDQMSLAAQAVGVSVMNLRRAMTTKYGVGFDASAVYKSVVIYRLPAADKDPIPAPAIPDVTNRVEPRAKPDPMAAYKLNKNYGQF